MIELGICQAFDMSIFSRCAGSLYSKATGGAGSVDNELLLYMKRAPPIQYGNNEPYYPKLIEYTEKHRFYLFIFIRDYYYEHNFKDQRKNRETNTHYATSLPGL